MHLSNIFSDPTSALIYMERFVNNGSPSGFSFSYTTSEATSPRGANHSFYLGMGVPKDTVSIIRLGSVPCDDKGTEIFDHDVMLIHPDMYNAPATQMVFKTPIEQSNYSALPTSSGRTVCVLNPKPLGFLKLHYEKIIGRLERNITTKHALAAIETDGMLYDFVTTQQSPQNFAFFRESYASVLVFDDGISKKEWGMVWRDWHPIGINSNKIHCLVPGFSLFSQDLNSPQGDTILKQLGEIHSSRVSSFLLEDLLFPLVNNYFSLITNLGLQGEWHAQNVLFGFDKSWNCVATVLRDFESIDRDLPLMRQAGIDREFASYPYKCSDSTDYNYSFRHSFMFDHKLGEYLLSPIINHACQLWNINSNSLIEPIRELVDSHLKQLPKDFFPSDGGWYKYPNTFINRESIERPYVRYETPIFRF